MIMATTKCLCVCMCLDWLVGWLNQSCSIVECIQPNESDWMVCVQRRRCWYSLIVPGLMALFSRGIQYLGNKIQLLTENYGNAIINIRRKSNFNGNSQFERQKAQRFSHKQQQHQQQQMRRRWFWFFCLSVAGKRIELRFIMLYCTRVSWINETYEVVLMWCEWNDVYGLLLHMGNGYRYCRVNINAIRLRTFSWQCPLFHC